MPKKSNPAPIRFLHLSDFHFSSGKAWDADPILRELAGFIGREVKAGLQPDLVAITGDLAFSGSPIEYALAKAWLEQELWSVLPRDFPRSSLLLVPGNHDVDRLAVNFVAQAVQSSLLNAVDQMLIGKLLADPVQREVLLKRHHAYLSFLSDWLGESQTLPWWQRSIILQESRLQIAGLDSAFMAWSNDDRSRLLLSRYQINQTIATKAAESTDWRIALLHHPWDYLAESDSHESRAQIHQHCDLVLRGHLHQTQTERVVPPDPSRACLELAAGCVYENSQYPNAFQWVELWPEPKRVKVLYRAWLHNTWAIDRNQPGCPDGAAEYVLSTSSQANQTATRQAKQTKANPKTKPIAEVPGLDRYREAAESLHASIPLAGFKTKLRVSIDLTELYVPLHAMVDLRPTGECGFADAHDAMTKLEGHGSMEIPLIRAFAESKQRKRRGLVILGDPGSGKTTHLKRLLLACLRDGPQTLGLEADTVPVFLPLRMLDDLNAGIDAFIEKTLEDPHFGTPQGFGKRLLDRGHLLLMFDGLDEVSEPKQRARVSRWIEQAAKSRPSCTAVVTCRFAGYDDQARLGSDFLELHLRPLTPEQAETFIRNWYRAVETGLAIDPAQGAIAADERATGLVQRLLEPDFRSQRMAEMTRNPLLLANLCLVHRDRGTLPRNRHKLYDECIDVLLERWREAKTLPLSITAELGRRALQPAALWLHGQEQRTRATVEELAPVIEPVLQSLRWQGGDAAMFLHTVRDESGLLTGWGPDQYGFMHLGFQEYLAALEIRRRAFEGDKATVMQTLAAHYGQSWWQEVILLLLAQGNPSLFVPFMQAALRQPGFANEKELLGFIMEEAAEVSAEPFVEFLQECTRNPLEKTSNNVLVFMNHFIKLLPSEDSRVLLKHWCDASLASLREYGHADSNSLLEFFMKRDSGQRVNEAEPSSFFTANGNVELLSIPGGSFLMGSPDGMGKEREHPQHLVTIKPFWLGRYPITNAQYRSFLQANPNVKEPAYWANRRFNQDQQPVVGVTWEEALKFCNWVGGRLPSEAEWEYACRAGTATSFHWGDDVAQAAEYAWFGEDWQKGSTHAVGEKQPNPWGLQDMIGNVWEWVQDVWHEDYQGAPEDGSAWESGGDQGFRVVRGGSWNNDQDGSRCAVRGRDQPGSGRANCGFRVVVVCSAPVA